MTSSTTGRPAPAFPMARAHGCPLDPPVEYAALRADTKMHKFRIWDGGEHWLITRYDDVRAALGNPNLSTDSYLPGFPHVTEATVAARTQSRVLVQLNGEEHQRYRRMLTGEFMLKRIEAMRPRVQSVIDLATDRLLAGPQPADLVETWALPIPSTVICELLGVPYEDHAFFQECAGAISSHSVSKAQALVHNGELLAYIAGLIERKKTQPGDDLISRMLEKQVNTGGLDEKELVDICKFLLVAGHETTAGMLELGVLFLLRNPAAAAEIRDTDDPRVVNSAVEELLRIITIVQGARRRIATADVEIGGQLIRRGEGVLIAAESANRDPDIFANPDELDIHRVGQHHVAFGFGPHQCLGQPLARLELQIAYRTLLRKAPGLVLDAPLEDLPYRHDMIFYGTRSMPVRW